MQFPMTLHFNKRLKTYRFGITFCLCGELLGSFLTTMGLFAGTPILFLIVGIFLKCGGGILSSFLQNHSALMQSLEIEEQLKILKSYTHESQALLSEKGCSEAEIRSLPNLPLDVYQAELQSFQRNRLLNLLTPLSCSLALVINGEIVLPLVIIFFGMISFPLGEFFFKQHAFRQESELRLGKSARLISYLRNIYKDHIKLTLKINGLSQLPVLLFAIRVIWNSSGELLASFYGLTQGLIGLTESLAFQRVRVLSQRSTLTTKKLYEVLSNPEYIITPNRWKVHVEAKAKREYIRNFESGMALVDFKVRNLFSPVTISIKQGHIQVRAF